MTTDQTDIDVLRKISEQASDRVAMVNELVQHRSVGTFLEIGVWKGRFAQRLLESVPQIRNYYMIDPWRMLEDWNKPYNVEQIDFEAIYEEAMTRTEAHADRRTVLRGRTVDMIGSIEDGSIDMLYIDGDHTLRGIVVDLVAAWPKVRPGGVVMCDDFAPSIWQHDARFEPSMVFPAAVHFAEAVQARIVAIAGNQCVILKPDPGETGFEFVDLVGSYRDISVRGQLAKQALPSMVELLRMLGRKARQKLSFDAIKSRAKRFLRF